MKIFNPDDEVETVRWDSKEFEIPSGWSELPAAVAIHAEATLGKWGITALTSERKKAEVEKQAKERWAVSNKQWAEDVILDFYKSSKLRMDAGLKVVEPDEVTTAKKLLKKLE